MDGLSEASFESALHLLDGLFQVCFLDKSQFPMLLELKVDTNHPQLLMRVTDMQRVWLLNCDRAYFIKHCQILSVKPKSWFEFFNIIHKAFKLRNKNHTNNSNHSQYLDDPLPQDNMNYNKLIAEYKYISNQNQAQSLYSYSQTSTPTAISTQTDSEDSSPCLQITATYELAKNIQLQPHFLLRPFQPESSNSPKVPKAQPITQVHLIRDMITGLINKLQSNEIIREAQSAAPKRKVKRPLPVQEGQEENQIDINSLRREEQRLQTEPEGQRQDEGEGDSLGDRRENAMALGFREFDMTEKLENERLRNENAQLKREILILKEKIYNGGYANNNSFNETDNNGINHSNKKNNIHNQNQIKPIAYASLLNPNQKRRKGSSAPSLKIN